MQAKPAPAEAAAEALTKTNCMTNTLATRERKRDEEDGEEVRASVLLLMFFCYALLTVLLFELLVKPVVYC